MVSGHYTLFPRVGDEKVHVALERPSSHSNQSGPESNLRAGDPEPVEDSHSPNSTQTVEKIFAKSDQVPLDVKYEPEEMDNSQIQNLTSPEEKTYAESKQLPMDFQPLDRTELFTTDDSTSYHNKESLAIDPVQDQIAPLQSVDEMQGTYSQLLPESRPNMESEDTGDRHQFITRPLFIDPHVSRMESLLQKEEPDFSKEKDLYFGGRDKLRTAEDGICSDIHILGTGNIGKFIAHSLAGMPNGPKVTLLLHRPLRIQEWYDEGQSITLYDKEEPNTRTGFEVESCSSIQFSLNESYPAFGPNLETSVVPPTSIIDNLIVTTKATSVVSALKSVKSRLRPTSTICFIHNGMGVMDIIAQEVFPNPVTRPHLVFGTISHGIGSVPQRKFSCTYNGNGVLDICSIDRYSNELTHPQFRFRNRGLIIHRKSVGYPPSVRYLMRTLTRCTDLKGSGHSYNKFFLIQLEKLAVNAVINPLSVIYNCTNKDLLDNEHIASTMRSLLREISAVMLALPELRNEKMTLTTDRATLEKRFSPERLYALVVGVAKKTGKNFSSTLQDVKRGERTEIGIINGYVVQRGREVGVGTPINEFMVDVVRGKERLVKKELEGYVPFRSPKL